ncbi:MAG TPA: hypothetical protein VHM88_14485, partial [Candidatus Acidoferrales bacterium]|nr:hypothetical protein [Candidatus Acidoferrales bacterium]
MIPHHIYYQLVIVGLLWLCVMLHYVWPSQDAVSPPPPVPPQLKRQRSKEPTPFVGLTTKPPCDACEHSSAPCPQPPASPPPRLVPTRGRRRQVDTSRHFCPNPDCAYRGWV